MNAMNIDWLVKNADFTRGTIQRSLLYFRLFGRPLWEKNPGRRILNERELCLTAGGRNETDAPVLKKPDRMN